MRLLALALAACAHDPAPTPAVATLPAADPVLELQQLRDQACACDDARCASGAVAAHSAWKTRPSTHVPSPKRLIEERWQHHHQEMRERELEHCAAAAMAEPERGGDATLTATHEAQAFRHQMCACRDSGCATKVADAYSTWQQTLPADVREGSRNLFDRVGDSIETCLRGTMID